MIVVDSSVWIDFFRGTMSSQVQRLHQALADSDAAIPDVCLHEVIAGARSDLDGLRLETALAGITVVDVGGQPAALRAAGLYRRLRSAGFTPRTAVDMLIASYCIQHDLPLLHDDSDFTPMEKHLGLRTR